MVNTGVNKETVSIARTDYTGGGRVLGKSECGKVIQVPGIFLICYGE